MYSGGLDSTLLAALLAKKFKRLYLVTYDLPYTMGLSNVLKNLKKLKSVNPDCAVTHKIVNLKKPDNCFLILFSMIISHIVKMGHRELSVLPVEWQ